LASDNLYRAGYSGARRNQSSLLLMSAGNPKARGYSADVRMHLNVNGHILAIGQLGPDFLILREAIDHPPTDASIFLSIDGDERRWNVHLPNGIQVSEPKTRICHWVKGSAVG
jgi:hypothetical protein